MRLTELQPMQLAVMTFSLIFMVVGIYRIVEFNHIGLRESRRKILITLHIIGVSLFAVAMGLQAFNFDIDRRNLMFACFVAALIFIAPGQFTIGMIRKRVIEEQMIAEGKKVVRRKPLISKLFGKRPD